jgi:hypothetical protein
MRRTVDVADLTLDQARALLTHADSHLDAIVATNNTFTVKLVTLANECPPAMLLRIVELANEWSAFQNRMGEASDAEMRRILEINQPHASTLQ